MKIQVSEVGKRRDRASRRWGRTQVLKVMAVWLTPRLLSWSSSWNLIGKGGAMVKTMRSALRVVNEE